MRMHEISDALAEMPIPSASPPPPQDRKRLVQLTAALSGLSISLPLSSVIASSQYFDARMAGSDYGYVFTCIYATMFIGIKFGVVLWGLFTGQQLQNRQGKPGLAVFGLSAGLLIMLGLTVSDSTAQFLFYSLLSLTIVLSVTAAKLEAGTFGVFATFPAHIVQTVFIGQGMAGIWSSGIALLLQAAMPLVKNSQKFALFNFGFAFAIVAFCAIMWAILERSSRFFQFYTSESIKTDKTVHKSCEKSSYKQVFVQVYDLALVIFLSTFLGMLMFPFMVNKTYPYGNNVSEKWWTLFRPFGFFVASLADLAGKWSPSIPFIHDTSVPLISIASIRVFVFIGLLLGNLQIEGRKLPWEPLLPNDVLFFILLAISGLINGLVVTLASMRAPLRFSNDGTKARAARVISLCNLSGNLLGALSALVFAWFLKFCSKPI